MKIYTKAGMDRICNMFDKRLVYLLAIDKVLEDKAEVLKAKYDIPYYIKTMEYINDRYEEGIDSSMSENDKVRARNYATNHRSAILSETKDLWAEYISLLENKKIFKEILLWK